MLNITISYSLKCDLLKYDNKNCCNSRKSFKFLNFEKVLPNVQNSIGNR